MEKGKSQEKTKEKPIFPEGHYAAILKAHNNGHLWSLNGHCYPECFLYRNLLIDGH